MATNIIATQSGVYAEVDIITAYMGAKADLYDTLPTLDADRQLLDVYWRDAKAWAVASLGSIIKADQSAENEVRLTVDIADDAPASCLTPLLRCALARYIIWRWLQVCDSATQAEVNYAQAQSAISGMRSLAHAARPTLRRIPPL